MQGSAPAEKDEIGHKGVKWDKPARKKSKELDLWGVGLAKSYHIEYWSNDRYRFNCAKKSSTGDTKHHPETKNVPERLNRHLKRRQNRFSHSRHPLSAPPLKKGSRKNIIENKLITRTCQSLVCISH